MITPEFFTRAMNGLYLTASIDKPRFCVGAKTKQESIAKAIRAIIYHKNITAKLKLTNNA
jgi:hypothetical protein